MTDAPDPRVVRNLKILVITLGVLIVLGLFTVVGRIIYLAARPDASGTASAAAAYAASQRVELPQGANVKSLSLSGNKLAIHYVSPAKSGVAIVDLETGRTVVDLDIQASVPRN